MTGHTNWTVTFGSKQQVMARFYYKSDARKYAELIKRSGNYPDDAVRVVYEKVET